LDGRRLRGATYAHSSEVLGKALEEIRQKLAGIHSGLEKQGGGKR